MSINDLSMQSPKISPQFEARLEALKPNQTVRAILVIDVPERKKNRDLAPPSRQERQAAIEAVRKSAQAAVGAVDEILERHGGQRLSTAPNALGAMPVEATAKGLRELAASEYIRAILEDQEISYIE
ncbi:MAG: hypothetical protein OEZ02_09485 [Anaerolineae bacterium]|nr:hypothetical protein [Anaerolineae bacterium]